MHTFNGSYTGANLDRLAFPLGGLGAGMVALAGHGALTQVALRHQPAIHHEPYTFAGLHVKGRGGVLLQGPAPHAHVLAMPGSGGGLGNVFGLPRFEKAEALARFPFLEISLSDPHWPVEATVTGWSPFVPGQPDDSSLPVACLEYGLRNRSRARVQGVLSFHAQNFMRVDPRRNEGHRVRRLRGAGAGFVLEQDGLDDHPEHAGAFAAFCPAAGAVADCAWFRGGWFDAVTLVWEAVAEGRVYGRPPHRKGGPGAGGSLYAPFALDAGQTTRLPIMLAWHVPCSALRAGTAEEPAPCDCGGGCGGKEAAQPPPVHVPWYASRFKDVDEVSAFWKKEVPRLREESARFRDAFFDTTLPPEVVEAAAANLSILKSPTCLRQGDGRFWAWEGCSDNDGCCHGSCTHVWNYAQALPHLFPSLERGLRETEFRLSQNAEGHQNMRALLPVRPGVDHYFHAALDGQLGGIVKLHREWRVGGDTGWLRSLWPAARQSLEYCLRTWDPARTGVIREPHHNTYDIEFWGPDAMAQAFLLAALEAAATMAEALGEPAAEYRRLGGLGRRYMERELWNGRYFHQRVQWKNLRSPRPDRLKSQWNVNYSPEALALLRREGPKYQYGAGVLSDALWGGCLARWCGLPEPVAAAKARRHLESVFEHNFKPSLQRHANPQRPAFAFGDEGGLVLCSWPRGGKPRLPMVYAEEVWTGIEYQVAAHLAMHGKREEARTVVATARKRYDGRRRNPFDEFECGHYYARAMSSYGLLQAWTGTRYDAVDKVLYMEPPFGGDFRVFISAGTGFGVTGVARGKPFLEVRHGAIAADRIHYVPAPAKVR